MLVSDLPSAVVRALTSQSSCISVRISGKMDHSQECLSGSTRDEPRACCHQGIGGKLSNFKSLKNNFEIVSLCYLAFLKAWPDWARSVIIAALDTATVVIGQSA